jgi:hypothetical protein
MTGRSREATEFLAAVDRAAPDAVSACDGWTTHEIAAHVTGIAVEVIRHLEPSPQGDPVQKTRSFEEREAPLQATGHAGARQLFIWGRRPDHRGRPELARLQALLSGY